MFTKAEFIKAIQQADAIYVWVVMTRHDGCYVKVSTASILNILANESCVKDSNEFECYIERRNKVLYIG